jgi:hypothetical protein
MAQITSLAVSEFGGYPFLDASFNPRRLITAAACVRWGRAVEGHLGLSGRDLVDVMDPHVALAIRRLDLLLDVGWSGISTSQATSVSSAIGLITGCVPEWQELLGLPVVFGSMPAGWSSISASSFAWPQHIWLSGRAFVSEAVLAEQVLHEISHQWIYLIEELAPLQTAGCEVRVVLPSGTGDRSLSELLGALHVSLNLRRLWRELPVDEVLRQRRLAHLEQYVAGCRQILATVDAGLTDEGAAIAQHMTEGATAV